jgi:tetratricopeptide (TPR) repeat protein
MKFNIYLKVTLVLVLCVYQLGCQHENKQPKAIFAEEISKRQARQIESMNIYHLGLTAYHDSLISQAHEHFTNAINVDEQNVYAWMMLGLVEYKQDNLFKAAYAFHQAAVLEPDRYEPHFNIGTIQESVDRYGQAIEAYETALKLAPDQVEIMENLARCYIKTNQKLDKAQQLIVRALVAEQRPQWRMWLENQALRLSSKKEEN